LIKLYNFLFFYDIYYKQWRNNMKLLKCKICGHQGKQLYQHIKYKHNLSGEEYKKIYGECKLQIVTNKQRKQRSEISKNGGSMLCSAYWIKLGYTKDQSKNKISELQSKISRKRIFDNASTSLQYRWWMKKYNLSENEAKEKVREIQAKNSSKSKKFLGKNHTKKSKQNISRTMSLHIKQAGIKDWASHFGDFEHQYRSKPEIEIFDYIKNNINNDIKGNVFVGNNNVDILYKNKIIEFFGDYWHCNPIKYDGNFNHPHKNKMAKEIWLEDKDRINKLKLKNFDLLVVWENNWNKDKNTEIIKIKRFLNG